MKLLLKIIHVEEIMMWQH